MDEELYIQIKENLTEDLGYEPTEEQITAEYAAMCDSTYDRLKDY